MAVTSANAKLTAAQKRRLRFDEQRASAPDERKQRLAVTLWWLSECRKLPYRAQVAELDRMVEFVAALNEGRVTHSECHDAMPVGDANGPGGFSGSIRAARDARDQHTTTGIYGHGQ